VNLLPKILESANKHKERSSDSQMEELVTARKMTSLFVS